MWIWIVAAFLAPGCKRATPVSSGDERPAPAPAPVAPAPGQVEPPEPVAEGEGEGEPIEGPPGTVPGVVSALERLAKTEPDTVDAFFELLAHAQELVGELESLLTSCDDESYELAEAAPLLDVWCDDIGQAPMVGIRNETWNELARRTPSGADDAWVHMSMQLYGDLSGRSAFDLSWPCVEVAEIEQRLGYTKLPEPLVSEGEVARDGLVSLLEEGPYCPGPEAELRAQLRRIAGRADLSEDQRQRIKAAAERATPLEEDEVERGD
jgi:hypothetical protein